MPKQKYNTPHALLMAINNRLRTISKNDEMAITLILFEFSGFFPSIKTRNFKQDWYTLPSSQTVNQFRSSCKTFV